jgi:hypothetical protein
LFLMQNSKIFAVRPCSRSVCLGGRGFSLLFFLVLIFRSSLVGWNFSSRESLTRFESCVQRLNFRGKRAKIFEVFWERVCVCVYPPPDIEIDIWSLHPQNFNTRTHLHVWSKKQFPHSWI